jgi:ParB family transcriptional regulator, chromosome partitioning protein
MITQQPVPEIELIPIDRVIVINPRVRSKRTFKEIVINISDLGLKRPITVSRAHGAGGIRYNLVCGQGRLEAYKALGQREIPAIVIDASNEDALVMSLVENCARRKHRGIDLLSDVEGLKRRGYNETEISKKTGLSYEYVRGVIRLVEKGEQRLLRAVESGQIPVSVAIDIAESDDVGVQQALRQAYESNLLRGKKLMAARRLIEQRQQRGKGLRTNSSRRGPAVSSQSLIRTYTDDADRKRLLIRKAEVTRDRLLFVFAALKNLFGDENFVTLLRAEGLDTLPRNLANRVTAGG